jgi:pyrroline-5-carboxylate reductase
MAETRALMVVGGGKMGEALLAGLIRTGWTSAEAIVVVEQDAARREELANRHPGLRVAGTVGEASSGSTIQAAVIAVKPADTKSVCESLSAVGIRKVLSIAAGITTGALEGWLASKSAPAPAPAVVRAMPNTPALVGAGAAAISPGRAAGTEDVAWARGILEAVGTVVELPEASLDAVTGLSGSGPAYVFFLAEAMIDAGVLVGLAPPVARDLAVQTLLGSARLLAETGEEPSALRAAVTSPGGTTAAGIRALEAAGVRNAVLEAVTAATERSRQMGQPP